MTTTEKRQQFDCEDAIFKVSIKVQHTKIISLFKIFVNSVTCLGGTEIFTLSELAFLITYHAIPDLFHC